MIDEAGWQSGGSEFSGKSNGNLGDLQGKRFGES